MKLSFRTLKILKSLLFVALLSSSSLAFSVERVKVMALFPNKAMLQIDGRNHVLSKGDIKNGVELIEANPQQAIVIFNGEECILLLGSAVAGSYKKREQHQSRIVRNTLGSYRSGGLINGQSVEMLVDTGASFISMNREQAKKLGIQFLQTGQAIKVQTASGVVSAWKVNLKKVRVGEIELNNIAGVVVDNPSSPKEVLLGMSFLNRVDIENKNGVMLLKKIF